MESKRANFPIVEDPNTFKGWKPSYERWVGQEAATMLERVQPYHAPNASLDAMLFVHENDIRDKHKLLIPVVYATPKGVFRAHRTGNREVSMGPITRRVQDDAVFLSFTIGEHERVKEVELEASLGIVFGPQATGGPTVIESLRQFIEIAEKAGAMFGPFAQGSSAGSPGSTPPR